MRRPLDFAPNTSTCTHIVAVVWECAEDATVEGCVLECQGERQELSPWGGWGGGGGGHPQPRSSNYCRDTARERIHVDVA